MDVLRIRTSESPSLLPLAIPALHTEAIRILIGSAGENHPYPVAISAWNQLVTSFHRTLDSLESCIENTFDDTYHKNGEVLCDHLRDLLYRSAEFTEIIVKLSEKLIRLSGNKINIKIPRSLDRSLSEQCNALKHEGFSLTIVGGFQGLFNIPGYQIRCIKNGSISHVERFHEKRNVYSFNVEMRRILSDLYTLGNFVGSRIIDVFGECIHIKQQEETFRLIDRVCRMPKIVFPNETTSDMPVINFDGSVFEFCRRGGILERPPGNEWRIVTTFTSDGFTTNWVLPTP